MRKKTYNKIHAMENTELKNAANEIKRLLNHFDSGVWVQNYLKQGKDPEEWCIKVFDVDLVNACDKFLGLFNEEKDSETKKNAVNIFMNELNVFLDGLDFKYIEAFKLIVSHTE